jgi:CheY-like chemotaxis protein
LRLSVEDKGRGFSPLELESNSEKPAGFGLFSIRERMLAMDGVCEIISAPGKGATVVLFASLDGSDERSDAAEPEASPEDSGQPERSESEAESEATQGPITVIVADDHSMMRQRVSSIIENAPDMTVIDEVADGKAALESTRRLQPDVVLMDVNMPVMNGIQATRAISNEAPGVAVIGLSVHADDATMQAMMDAGAKAYVPKDKSVESLLTSIRELTGGVEGGSGQG